MKGTIANCIQSLVTQKFGIAKWNETLSYADIPATRDYSTLEDVPDAEIMALMQGASRSAGISLPQIMDAFGEYWSTVYAPSIYKSFFDSAKSTRELLLKLDEIHVAMTRSIKNAKPPRFTYEWQDDKHLVMNYQSDRGLVELMPGLIAGLGKFYKDSPTTRLVGNQVHVTFN
jgi:methyl-accepting chemotaxis protein